MNSWFAARWQAFLGSFDPDDAAAQSSPIAALAAAVVLTLVFVMIGELPPLGRMSQETATLPCVALALIGSTLSYTAFRRRCRGRLGSLSTLLDNGFYAASLSLAAVTM